MQRRAIILFSGGLDSTACLAIAKSEGYACYALSMEYGQKNRIELERAVNIAEVIGVEQHKILTLPLDQIGGSSCTSADMAVPDYEGGETIPSTYVPARNTIFLSFALAWAEVIEAYDIFFGANSQDYAEYPDCQAPYLRAFEQVANLATRAGVEGKKFTIHTPLINMNKADIIREGVRLGVDYSLTISCYRPNSAGYSCGTCGSCTYRKRGFLDAGVNDPTLYVR